MERVHHQLHHELRPAIRVPHEIEALENVFRQEPGNLRLFHCPMHVERLRDVTLEDWLAVPIHRPRLGRAGQRLH